MLEKESRSNAHGAAPNGLRLSGARKRVRCSRVFGGIMYMPTLDCPGGKGALA
jgi:hypothetical protein